MDRTFASGPIVAARSLHSIVSHLIIKRDTTLNVRKTICTAKRDKRSGNLHEQGNEDIKETRDIDGKLSQRKEQTHGIAVPATHQSASSSSSQGLSASFQPFALGCTVSDGRRSVVVADDLLRVSMGGMIEERRRYCGDDAKG